MPCVKINNVGTASGHMMSFLDQDEKTVMHMINVNMTTCIMLTHAFPPIISVKGRGAIINISSVASM